MARGSPKSAIIRANTPPSGRPRRRRSVRLGRVQTEGPNRPQNTLPTSLPGDRPRTIVLSGRGRQEDVTRAFQLGADDFVTKPFDPQELMARVARLLK